MRSDAGIRGRGATAVLAGLAMIAFAANSVLCRLALGGQAIDAASFAAIRVATGAMALVLIASASRGIGPRGRGGSWLSGLMLSLYVVAFSFAYLSLGAGTGALILIGSVQIAMILGGLRSGERPRAVQWLGLALAFAGMIYLVSPGLEAPPAGGSLLMALAGVSWGIYSLRGRGGVDPIAATADNFVRSVPFVSAMGAAGMLVVSSVHWSPRGVVLAAVSGTVTSGLGYIVWYAALRGLTATTAATVQLSVPVLAAVGGVIFIAEPVTFRLVASALLILSGVGLAVSVRTRVLASR